MADAMIMNRRLLRIVILHSSIKLKPITTTSLGGYFHSCFPFPNDVVGNRKSTCIVYMVRTYVPRTKKVHICLTVACTYGARVCFSSLSLAWSRSYVSDLYTSWLWESASIIICEQVGPHARACQSNVQVSISLNAVVNQALATNERACVRTASSQPGNQAGDHRTGDHTMAHADAAYVRKKTRLKATVACGAWQAAAATNINGGERPRAAGRPSGASISSIPGCLRPWARLAARPAVLALAIDGRR